MKDDPIVAEVRAIRDELARQCGFDLKEIFRQLRQQQCSSGGSTFAIQPVGSSQPRMRKRAMLTLENVQVVKGDTTVLRGALEAWRID